MHDIDRTQLELQEAQVQEAEVQDEILRKAFGRVAAWLRRPPARPPALPSPHSPMRASGRIEEVREKLHRAHTMLQGLVNDKAGAHPSLARVYDRAIRDQRQVVATLEAELRRLQGGG